MRQQGPPPTTSLNKSEDQAVDLGFSTATRFQKVTDLVQGLLGEKRKTLVWLPACRFSP